jgi:hypothetical protein
MERKKGSFIMNETGSFEGRFKAIVVNSNVLIESLSDNKNREGSLSLHIQDPRSEIVTGSIISAINGVVFTEISISKGSIEIIF